MSEHDVPPATVFELVAKDIPADLHPNLLIAGSLAAAYHHRSTLVRDVIRTKDADVVVQPAGALVECRQIATRLRGNGWRLKPDKCWPHDAPGPVDRLCVIRLLPPSSDLYFVELIGLPLATQQEPKVMVPCQLADGWFCVPCFRYMAVLAEDQRRSHVGIPYASPAMMALANLLAHPQIGTTTIAGTDILRAAKDLGRVLALTILADDADFAAWSGRWWAALQTHFPEDAPALAKRAGAGIRALLSDAFALGQALQTTTTGLLFGKDIRREQLEIAAAQLLKEPIADLEKRAI